MTNISIGRASACFILLLIGTLRFQAFSDDLLMLRNGQEIRGKLEIVSDKDILFSHGSSSHGQSDSYPVRDVYMIKTEKRGTIFYNTAGSKSMVGSVKNNRKATYIYLVNGGEIEAWNLRMANGIIKFTKNPKLPETPSNTGVYPTEDIFLIKYPDGSKDLITEISGERLPNGSNANIVGSPTKIKVIMVEISKSTTTIGDIAKEYKVAVEDIVEWNNLPKGSASGSRLSAGTQLMIQIEEPVNP